MNISIMEMNILVTMEDISIFEMDILVTMRELSILERDILVSTMDIIHPGEGYIGLKDG